jgi:hypothetical protein
MGPTGVIDAIAETITRYKRLPVYVAEGTSIGKLAHIYSLPYLRHCYEKALLKFRPLLRLWPFGWSK